MKKKQITHCVSVAKSKAIIFGTEVADLISEVATEFESNNIKMIGYGPDSPHFAVSLDKAIESMPETPIDR